MSNYDRAIPVLPALTKLQVFVDMARDGIVRPVTVGTHNVAMKAAPAGSKSKVRSALHYMSRSRRYLIACLQPNAQRHNSDGLPVSPVTESQREWAQKQLDKKNGHRAAKEAARAASQAV